MIPVRNIYYMMAYAFRSLDTGAAERMGTEDFENSPELCAAVLAHGIELQVKRGLGCSYVERAEQLSTLRGRVDVSASLKTNSFLKKQLVCEFDELSEDTSLNRIVKATMRTLLCSREVSVARKKPLRKLMPYFAGVSDVDLRRCDWNVRIDRSNRGYRILLFVCRLVADALLMNYDGEQKQSGFIDDQAVCKLYERFILEYYRREHPELSVSAAQILWAIDDDFLGALPTMQTDITLRQSDRVLVIDAKYYAHTMQENYGVRTLHSGNLYQIFTYVKNMQESLPAGAPPVAGMLMYARTDEPLLPDGDYRMSGNPVSVRSLDLTCDFEGVRKQLDGIVERFFDSGV